MNTKRVTYLCTTLGLVTVLAFTGLHKTAAAKPQTGTTAMVEEPKFEVDPSWPKPLPQGWKFADVSDVNTDSQGNVWVLQRPDTQMLPGEKTGPPVMEFDQAGNYIRGWGGQAKGYDWPEEEHGISVDNKNNVWIVGNWDNDQILKFTVDGKFIKQFGEGGHKKTNADTQNFWEPAAAIVYPKTNELFVADGYGNTRIIVIDPDTGAFKRMWGAFGDVPKDRTPRPEGPSSAEPRPPGGAEQFATKYFMDGGAEPPDQRGVYDSQIRRPVNVPSDTGAKQFNIIHGLAISNDGLVYAADRRGLRVQVFTIDGKYQKQVFIDRWCADPSAGCSNQTAGDVAFSADPEQRFLYVLCEHPGRVWVLERNTLQPLYYIGSAGMAPGEFIELHMMSADKFGDIYTAELNGRRVQKFVFKGLVKVPRNSLPSSAE
jgi:hypothetical protein